MDQPQQSAEQIVNSLNQQLLQALVSKQDAEAKVKEADTQITAIRNVLAGMQTALKSIANAAQSAAPVELTP